MRLSFLCLFLVCACCAAKAAEYHVDHNLGNDSNTGLSPESAWKSLAHLNEKVFQAGDHILFKAGTRYSGSLKLQGSGTKLKPIELSTYAGTRADASIDGEGTSLDTVLLQNIEYWNIHNLEITNHGQTTAPWRTGIRLESDDGHTLHGLHLSHLYVHDVNGDLDKEKEGCGIFFDSHRQSSCFDDLLIENCHVAHTDRNGICQRSSTATRSTHVIIRNNLLEDIGGDGIKLWGSDGGLIEHNTLHGGRIRCDDYAAGIWPFSSDDTVIQYNEVSGMHGTKDGQGFDSDYFCKGSIFQFNYSHNNDGGFMLICAPGWSFCRDTIVRYNVSQNDGQSDSSVFHFGGNSSNTAVYNNVIYLGKGQKVPLLRYDTWDKGDAHHTIFNNNVFYAQGQASYRWGKSVDNVFEFNAFVGNHISPPRDEHAVVGSLPFVSVGTGDDGFDSLLGYKWKSGVPAPRGIMVTNNGGRDFFGAPVPADSAPSIGVSQR